MNTPKFAQLKPSFHTELKKRISYYFETTGKSTTGNWRLWIKAAILLVTLTGLYIHLVFFTPALFRDAATSTKTILVSRPIFLSATCTCFKRLLILEKFFPYFHSSLLLLLTINLTGFIILVWGFKKIKNWLPLNIFSDHLSPSLHQSFH